MIDVYCTAGTFSDKSRLAQELASAVMRWEAVPGIPLFADNTAAFIHDLPAEAISNVTGRGDYVRVQVLTPAGVLDRDKQLGVVKDLTDIVARGAAPRRGSPRSCRTQGAEIAVHPGTSPTTKRSHRPAFPHLPPLAASSILSARSARYFPIQCSRTSRRQICVGTVPCCSAALIGATKLP